MTAPEQLPITSPAQNQERRSIKRLASILPDNIICREEGGGDFGVDRVFEVIAGDSVSNARMQVQVKSAKNCAPNGDGSFSYEIPIKSINYLRRHLGSLVLLFLEDQDIFKWEWISDVWAAWKKSADRRGQTSVERTNSTFSYRFTRSLDEHAFEEISAAALRFGETIRSLSEMVGLHGRGVEAHALVALNGGQVTDLTALADLLRVHGLALASAGRTDWIDEAARRLPGSIRDDSELQIVIAYSKFIQGDMTAALSLVRFGPAEEPSERRQIRELIHFTAAFMLGLLPPPEYGQKLRDLEKLCPESVLVAQIRVHALREQVFERRGEDVGEILQRLTDEVRRICARPDVSEDVKISTEMVLWDMEGLANRVSRIRLLGWVRLSERLTHDGPEPMRLSRDLFGIVQAEARWQERGDRLRERVSRSQSVLLVARMNTTSAMAYVLSCLDVDEKCHDSKRTTEVERTLHKTVQAMQQVGCLDIAARAELIRSDLLVLLTQHDAAAESRRSAEKMARQIGNRELERQAADSESTSVTAIRAAQQRLLGPPPSEEEQTMQGAAMSPEECQRHAEQLVSTFGLPKSRIPIARRGFEVAQRVFRERVDWCRHMSYREEMDRFARLETFLARDSRRLIRCDEYAHQTPEGQGGADIDPVIAQFKARHCEGCSSRTPLGTSPPG